MALPNIENSQKFKDLVAKYSKYIHLDPESEKEFIAKLKEIDQSNGMISEEDAAIAKLEKDLIAMIQNEIQDKSIEDISKALQHNADAAKIGFIKDAARASAIAQQIETNIQKEKEEAKKKAIEDQKKQQFNKIKSIPAYTQHITNNEDIIKQQLPLSDFDLYFNQLKSDNFNTIYSAITKFGIPKDNGEFILATLKPSLKQYVSIDNIIDNNSQLIAQSIESNISNNNSNNNSNNSTNIKKLGQTIIAGLSSTDPAIISKTLQNLGLQQNDANQAVNDQVIAENHYLYLIKKASNGHPKLKQLLNDNEKDIKTLLENQKYAQAKLDDFFADLTAPDKAKLEQAIKDLNIKADANKIKELIEENQTFASLQNPALKINEITTAIKKLGIPEGKDNSIAKNYYANNQLTFLKTEAKLRPTLVNAFDSLNYNARANISMILIEKNNDEIKEISAFLLSTDKNDIVNTAKEIKLNLDQATIDNIHKENLAVEQQEKIISQIPDLKDLMEEEGIQKDFLNALTTKTENEVALFINNVTSYDHDINSIQQQLEAFKLVSQGDLTKATEIYANNQFDYLLKYTLPNSKLHAEFNTNKEDIKTRIKGNQQQTTLSPKEIKDAFQAVKQAVDQTSMENGLKTLGIKQPSADLLKENVDLLAKDRMAALKQKQQLENRKKEIDDDLNKLEKDYTQKKPIADGGDKTAEQEIKDIENQQQKLEKELQALPKISDQEAKLKTARDEEDDFLKKKFINEQFTQPALAKAAADPSITAKGAQDKVEKAHLESLHESKKGDRTNRYDTTLLLAERYCLAAEKAALSNARHVNRSNDLTDTKKDLQENIAACKRVKAELLWYVEKLENERPQRKFASERIQKSKKCIAELNASIDAYEPAINQPLDKIVHFSSKSEVFTDMQERDKRISELLDASGQAAPLDQGSLTTDNNLASHFNTSAKFGNGARLNCLEENVGGKNINLLDNQQVIDGVFKTTAYFKLDDFKKCSRDQKLRYAIALIENHWAGDPSPHGKFKASANFPPELVELMAIYCKREHIEFVAPPQKPQSGLSKIFNQKPSEPTQKQVDDMDKKINENPTYFYGSEQLKTLTIRHEAIKDMQQKTGQNDIQSYTVARIG